MESGIQFPNGDNLKTERILVTNRTGGALTVGGVYALDIGRAAAESTTGKKAMGNLVAVDATNIDGILCVAETALADDETGLVVVEGPVMALVDGGTLDVLIGDKLIPTAASINLTKSAATTDVVCAKAWEGNTGAAALKLIYLMGFIQSPDGTAT